jgi:uncharacterized protein involved in response to NO
MISGLTAFTGMLLTFGAHALFFTTLLEIYKVSRMPDMHDSFWILVSVGIGLAAHLLFIGAFLMPVLDVAARESAVWGYLFMTAFSVAQRMVPFFSNVMPERNATFMRNLFLLVLAHILLEILYRGLGFLPDAIAAVLLFFEIRRWKLPFPNPDAMLWVLHIALFWTPIAFLFSAMEKLTLLLGGVSMFALGTHAIVLGFLFTILIGFGTRVTIGHSRNRMVAGMWERLLFNATQLVVVTRLSLSVAVAYGWNITPFFHAAVAFWMLTVMAWAWRFFPVLLFEKRLS